MEHSCTGAEFTNLVLGTFRFNGALITAGDELVSDLGLTSSRWQVLGVLPEGPATVAEIARKMGLSRQNVQRISNRLVKDGFIEKLENPAHRRAKLYILTKYGIEVMNEVAKRQINWANKITEGIDPLELTAAVALIQTVTQRLTQDQERRKTI